MPAARRNVLLIAAVLAAGFGIFLATNREQAIPPRTTAAQPRGKRPPQAAPAVRIRPISATADGVPEALRHEFEIRKRGYLNAAGGIEAVLAGLHSLGESPDCEIYLTGASVRASALDVPDALAWAASLMPGAPRDTALMELFHQWSGLPRMRIIANFPGGGGVAAGLGAWLLEAKKLPPAEIAAYSREFVFGPRRVGLIADAAKALAATDPTAAFSLGEGMTGESQMTFLRSFAEGWAGKDPQAAMRWAAAIPNESDSGDIMMIVADFLKARDPVAIAGWLAQISPRPAARKKLLEAFGSDWAAANPRAAWQWAESLPAGDREAALAGVSLRAPVGIGVAFGGISPDGVEISGVIADSPAGRSGNFEAGDRIVAFTDTGGGWVDIANMDLGEMVTSLRGEEGSRVSLRVRRGNDSALRTVTIQRGRMFSIENP